MAFLDDLKVTVAPATFAEMARAHNAVVDLLKTLQGQNGIRVTVSAGKIVIEQDPDTAAASLVLALDNEDVQAKIRDIVLNGFPSVEVDACGIGSRLYLTVP